MRSDDKYTLVVWEGGEALIRKTIRQLVDELDPEAFAQIHRSVIVNLRLVVQFDRGLNDSGEVRLKGRREVLPVSRSFFHVFPADVAARKPRGAAARPGARRLRSVRIRRA
jgi:DNA-binding LytR/AlgR family response regulator